MMIDWNELYLNGRDYTDIEKSDLEKVLAAAGKGQGSVLDLGCGTGDLSVKLASRGYTVTGIDLSENAISKAEAKAAVAGVKDKTSFMVANLDETMPEGLSQKQFEIITCKLVLAFIEDKQSFMQWIKLHLKPNGVFILITPIKYKGQEYSPKLERISVYAKQLRMLLKDNFSSYTVISKVSFDTNGEQQTIIARA